MEVIVIALKNVKACIVPKIQKRKRKKFEQKCQQKDQHKIDLKIPNFT